ncbi:MAG: RNHCP domain-containing protein [Planctomycetota bacterium]
MSNPHPSSSPSFRCVHCQAEVPLRALGTRHRNHCPHCLWSLHVDDEPGDRASKCRSPMEPIGIEVRADGEWAIIHRCTGCGTLKTNRVAGDDDESALLKLALKPLSRLPFPL